MKRTLAVIILALAAFNVAHAQAERRAAASNTPARAKSGAKFAAADKNPKASAGDEEVERLLLRNLMAQGGIAIVRIKTRITRGRVEMSESPIPGSYESYEKVPGKKMEVLNAPIGQFIYTADAGRRWGKSPWGLAVSLGGGEGESEGGGASGAPAFNWRRYFSSAKVRGRAVLDGREMVVLDATPKGERPVHMYFDAETWLLIKEEFSPHTPQQEDEFKAVVIDRYDVVDGVKVPTVFRQIFTHYTLTFRIYEVKHNVPIDDALFRDPNGK
ncbi:MAG TPA: hypothetical protein VGP08_14050 [Pyrinomonadaceae bacterium]|nr:hypothetical protein [Pyrinomonadaceae bacterium]